MFPVTPMRNIKTICLSGPQCPRTRPNWWWTQSHGVGRRWRHTVETERFRTHRGIPSFNSSPTASLLTFTTIVQTWESRPTGRWSAFGRGRVRGVQLGRYGEVWRRDRVSSSPGDQAGSSLGSADCGKTVGPPFLNKERPIKEALLGDDLAAARRLVNGGAWPGTVP